MADDLANWSTMHRRDMIFFSLADLPTTAKGAVKLGRLQIPYIQCKKKIFFNNVDFP